MSTEDVARITRHVFLLGMDEALITKKPPDVTQGRRQHHGGYQEG